MNTSKVIFKKLNHTSSIQPRLWCISETLFAAADKSRDSGWKQQRVARRAWQCLEMNTSIRRQGTSQPEPEALSVPRCSPGM